MQVFLLLCYAAATIGLLFYSYTQVDLSLTLTHVSVWQAIQHALQYIGFFQRPLSTALFLGLVGFLFIIYGFALHLVHKNALNKSWFWGIVIGVTVGLVLSYPAFSYDMFNYMFTAKTVLVYHKNPYNVIPLEFSGIEPWLSFMRWTHLPSAYTPLWIGLTLPAYIFGFGYLLLVMWNIKLIAAVAYLATTLFIGKILHARDPKNMLLGMAIFALNPLIIIETLVSGHNDIVMMAIAMAAIYYVTIKKSWSGYMLWSISVATKLMTLFLFPILFLSKKPILMLGCMLIGFFLVLTQREVLPWYWVWIMPFVALVPEKKWITMLASGVSLGLLLRYAPYLYLGHWDAPAPLIKWWVTFVPIGVASIITLFVVVQKKKEK